MTNPDYRALCANLTAALNDWQCETGDDRYEGLLDRARALLAEAVAEGPTDEEIPDNYVGHEKGFAQEHLARLMRDAIGTETNHNAYIVAAGRILDRPEFACVARWGRPVAAPVPEPGEVPRIGHILRLAEIIREVDGRHDKGAAALAEAILSHPGICSAGLAALDAEGPTIPNAKLHRQELTPCEVQRLIEALDFAIGDTVTRPNTGNHHAVRAKLKRSISHSKATNE